MAKFAVVKTGGKQYLVKENDVINVDQVVGKEKDVLDLETLAIFDTEKELELGMPTLAKKIKAEIVEHVKGEKLRIAKFKAKSRYRKVMGFRPKLSKLKIGKIT